MKRSIAVLIVLAIILSYSVAYSLTYQEVDTSCKRMTDAQFDEYSKRIVGTSVTWTGAVTDVKANWTNSDYEVRIDMDRTGVADVYFDVPKSLGMQLQRNASYTFTGTVKSVVKVFGSPCVTLKDVRFK